VTTCYRHPDRETGVGRSNCGRPICPDCMTQTPVGIRCPECARPRTRVSHAGFTMSRSPNVTYGIIAANLLLFALTNRIGEAGGGLFGGGQLNQLGADLAVSRAGIADGEYYRLITSAFVHFGLLHLAFNMYVLWLLGAALERYACPLRFAAIYFVSALAGSFGALLLTPDGLTAGASGAVFGLMGALLVLERQRGLALLGGSIVPLLFINLAITFAIPNISKGGHVGGLLGGILVGLVLSGFGRGHLAYGRLNFVSVAGVVALGLGMIAGSVAVST
jgi:membrane associated rhomboid family serine protease